MCLEGCGECPVVTKESFMVIGFSGCVRVFSDSTRALDFSSYFPLAIALAEE